MTAARPRLSATTAIFSRLNGWRPIAAATVPAARSGAPQTSARYSRLSEPLRPWSANSAARPWWAASFLATTSRPDVSLSRRWTIPGRLTPPIARQAVAAMANQRVDQRSGGVAGRGMDDEPGRLVDDEQMRVLEDDRRAAGPRRRSPRPRPAERRGRFVAPSATRAAGSRASAPSIVAWPASISAFSRVRDRASPRAAAAWLRKRSSRSPPSPAPTANASRSAAAASGAAVSAVRAAIPCDFLWRAA